jgi:TnpA family transposase
MSRIKLLQSTEIKSFDSPPLLNDEQQAFFFTVPEELVSEFDSLRQPYTRLGFLLQLGYFRSQGRFYDTRDFRQEDVQYLAQRYRIPLHRFVLLNEYSAQSKEQHQAKILRHLAWSSFEECKVEFEHHVDLLVERQLLPRKILWEIREYLFRQRIEAPAYDTYLRTITQALLEASKRISQSLETHLTLEHQQTLGAFLDKTISVHRADIVFYKQINQSLQPKAIKASVEQFRVLKERLGKMDGLIKILQLSDATIDYHAYWASISESDKIQDHHQKYLFLLCFLIRQVRLRQDFFIDIILQTVKAAENFTKRWQKEDYFQDHRQRNKATQLLVESRLNYRQQMKAVKAVIQSPLSDRKKVAAIESLLEVDLELPPVQEEQIQTLASQLNQDATGAFYRLWEKRSVWLSNRIGHLLKHLYLNTDNTDATLLAALMHYTEKNGKINAPAKDLTWLTEPQQDLLYSIDEPAGEPRFNHRLYKMFLFEALAEGIKSGTVNFDYSYRYRFLEEYLLDKKQWKENRQQWLSDAEMDHLADSGQVLEKLKEHLHTLYHQTNTHYLAKGNPHLKFNKDAQPVIDTPAVDKPDLIRISGYFREARYVSILSLLADVEKAAPFLQCFGHGSKIHEKKRPDAQTFFGAILALGCNIGVDRMSSISKGIQAPNLKHTADWYLTTQALQDANDAIIRLKNELALPELHRKDASQLHTASDGQKILLTQDSLNATYSAKYPGFNKASSINTAVDERFALFYSSVITAADREAVSMIDMHLGNPVVKSTIHSTDTHGTSEPVFGIMHLLDIFFAPRIKNLGSQELYSFVSRKTYADLGYPLLPDHYINTELIENNWEDILRLIASMKLGKASAFQLLKRLNSYAKQNPLYKALKELGKVIRTCFILKYLDDLSLRQSVEKQLSHIEMMNRFSKAIFFGNNQEFTVATKDEQEQIILCRRLIQNAIVLWNYMYLSDLLAKKQSPAEMEEMMEVIRQGTAVAWQHINMMGEYDFNQLSDNYLARFDIQQILAWKYKPAA